MNALHLRPQKGFQERFTLTKADIALGGGAGGAGKSFILLMDAAYDAHIPGYGATIFRRTSPQIRNQGGLWDTSDFYRGMGATPREFNLEWKFPNSTINFAHLQYESDAKSYQGAQIPYIGFDELTHFCLTPEHEVLTKQGWIKIDCLKTGDLVATLNKDESISYESVEHLNSFDYDGEIKSINQRNGVSFRATPNHRAVVMKQLPNRLKKKGSTFSGWQFKKVSDLKTCTIPRGGVFEGEAKEYHAIKRPKGRGHGVNSNSVCKIDMTQWCQFLGWYLSEGCSFECKNRTSSPVVSIRQTKKENHKELSEMLNNLGYRWRYAKDGQYRIFSRQLFNELKPFGNKYQKRVPDYIFTLSKQQQQTFFDAFVKGDGHVTSTGAISIGLCNEGLIDDLQVIALHIGYCATKGYTKTKDGFDVWRLTISNRARYTQVKKEHWTLEHYKGKVHCPTVNKNGNFLIRHNGRVCWTGNSEFQFWYLVSRNRSTTENVKSRVRATCNPDASSWVRTLVDWWVDENGYIIKERDGILRYFIRWEDKMIWGDSKDEVIEKAPFVFNNPAFAGQNMHDLVKSFTFIEGDIYDNQKLLKADPGYLGALLAQDDETRARLLEKNWNQLPNNDSIYNSSKVSDMFTSSYVPSGEGRIAIDAARLGSDLAMLYVFSGWRLIDVFWFEVSRTTQIAEKATELSERYNIPFSKIVVDADGVGGGVADLLPGCYEFQNNTTPIIEDDRPPREGEIMQKPMRPNYRNLKSQCYYLSAEKVNRGEVYIAPDVAEKSINGTTFKEYLSQEMRAIKKHNIEKEGKIDITPKDAIRSAIGRSPDAADAFAMNAIFDIVKPMQFVFV